VQVEDGARGGGAEDDDVCVYTGLSLANNGIVGNKVCAAAWSAPDADARCVFSGRASLAAPEPSSAEAASCVRFSDGGNGVAGRENCLGRGRATGDNTGLVGDNAFWPQLSKHRSGESDGGRRVNGGAQGKDVCSLSESAARLVADGGGGGEDIRGVAAARGARSGAAGPGALCVFSAKSCEYPLSSFLSPGVASAVSPPVALCDFSAVRPAAALTFGAVASAGCVGVNGVCSALGRGRATGDTRLVGDNEIWASELTQLVGESNGNCCV
jgi:hypothetical protein